MNQKIYLDNNATTKCDEEVLNVMLPYLKEEYGNPSSTYSFGKTVKEQIKKARQNIAKLINAETDEIIFTSCASESNVTAIMNAIKNNPIDILTHLNYLCYADSLEVAKCLSDYGTYLEINTKKVHLSDEEWQNIVDKTSVNFLIDSDAHSPDRVGDMRLANDLLSRINIPSCRIHNIEDRQPILRFTQFKEKL